MRFFGWLLGLIFGKKDKQERIADLERKESKSESKKSRLRLKEDVLRYKQAKTREKEKKIVGREVREINDASGRGMTEKKGVRKLIKDDEKILKKLRRDKRLARKIEKIAIKIEGEDEKEIRESAEIAGMTGKQPSYTQEKQDIQLQEQLKKSEEAQKQYDKKLFGLYRLKEKCEAELLKIGNEMSGLYGFIKPDSDKLFKPNFLQKKRARYYSLEKYKQQLELKIKNLEQQILNYEGAKAA